MKAFSILLVLAPLWLVTGCNLLPEPAPDNARYYVLTARDGTAAAPEADQPRVGLRPVEIASYLRNKAVAERRGASEVSFSRDARWAEPLEAGITRILRERIATRVRVAAHPFPAQAERDFDVTVRVLAADGREGGVNFEAVFEITRAGGEGGWLVRRNFRAAGSAWDGDYGRLAAVLGEAVAALADEIVAALPERG
jgi:uncharacterized lipoprotein YmbA